MVQKLVVYAVGDGKMVSSENNTSSLGDRVIEAEFEEGVVSVGACLLWARDQARLEKATLPSTLKTIGSNAFYGQTKLHDVCYSDTPDAWETVTLNDGNSPLLSARFHFSAGALAIDFTLPSALRTIEEEAFCGCAFRCVKLGEAAEKIGAYAFADSPNLKYIIIPATVEEIGTEAFRDAADGFMILAPAESFAETFAADNNIRFGVIDDAA